MNGGHLDQLNNGSGDKAIRLPAGTHSPCDGVPRACTYIGKLSIRSVFSALRSALLCIPRCGRRWLQGDFCSIQPSAYCAPIDVFSGSGELLHASDLGGARNSVSYTVGAGRGERRSIFDCILSLVRGARAGTAWHTPIFAGASLGSTCAYIRVSFRCSWGGFYHKSACEVLRARPASETHGV